MESKIVIKKRKQLVTNVRSRMIDYVNAYFDDIEEKCPLDKAECTIPTYVEKFLRKVSIMNGVAIRKGLMWSYKVKNLFMLIPFCLNTEIRLLARSIFCTKAKNTVVDTKSPLYLYICNIIYLYFKKYDNKVMVSKIEVMRCVRESLVNRKQKRRIIQFFGFEISEPLNTWIENVNNNSNYQFTCEWIERIPFPDKNERIFKKNNELILKLQQCCVWFPFTYIKHKSII
ncbi:hypothetical protein WA158_007384 [Blastocystis sp. Blastoise]